MQAQSESLELGWSFSSEKITVTTESLDARHALRGQSLTQSRARVLSATCPYPNPTLNPTKTHIGLWGIGFGFSYREGTGRQTEKKERQHPQP